MPERGINPITGGPERIPVVRPNAPSPHWVPRKTQSDSMFESGEQGSIGDGARLGVLRPERAAALLVIRGKRSQKILSFSQYFGPGKQTLDWRWRHTEFREISISLNVW